MPPGFPPGGFSYMYIFFIMFGGAARCFDGGTVGAVELWPGFCGGAAAHPNTKNPTGRRGSFYSFLLKYKVRTCSQR